MSHAHRSKDAPPSESHLFSPLRLRSVTFKNRVFVSPMCQYSCDHDGLAAPWHQVHLGRFALGGAGLVFTEATAVSPEGRISPNDLGLWSDAHTRTLRPIAHFLKAHGAVPGIQLAHAGRKASTPAPWVGAHRVDAEHGGWEPVAPSPLAFSPTHPRPAALDAIGIGDVVNQFVAATARAHDAGFEVIELHLAHGYLLHQFLSPLSNQREDSWGGDFTHRTTLPLAVVAAVRDAWPAHLPLFVRLSVTDWADGGWDLPQSIRFSAMLQALGVDLVDCSSGGLVAGVMPPPRAGLPGALRRGHQARGRRRHRSRRPDHRSLSGRGDHRLRARRRGAHRASDAARPQLGAARRRGAGSGRRVAGAVRAREARAPPAAVAPGLGVSTSRWAALRFSE
jgi:2,4-dienoyl-CoA reductase-like NADH-dependent reductase (Old Yellow Enzyme family)